MFEPEPDLKCKKCGISLLAAAAKGAYFERVNDFGQDFEGECRPSCDSEGNQDDALLRAIENG